MESFHTRWGTARLTSGGYYHITSGKEGNGGKKLHRLIYEAYYGEIPEGYVIHHIDGDKTNNHHTNLKAMSNGEHSRLHNTNRIFSEEHKKKLSESHKGQFVSEETKMKLSGKNHGRWINYARITKYGFNQNGNQVYVIRYDGKNIKTSIHPDKLEKWFCEKYPNEKLIMEV